MAEQSKHQCDMKLYLQREREEQDLKYSAIRWKARRRMAWAAFVVIVVWAGLSLFVIPDNRIELMDTIGAWFMTGMFTIIGSYIGASTLEHVFKNKYNTGEKD